MRLSLLVAAIAASFAAHSAAASGLSCPATLAADESSGGAGTSYKFRYVSFYDGDPAEMADLAPQEGPNPKVLEQRWQLTRTAGRPIVMVCRYHGTDRTVQKEVPAGIRECRLNGFVNDKGEIMGSPKLECR